MKSFRNRMFLIIVGLVLAIEAITMFAALRALERESLASAAQNLQIGERVFRDLLQAREEQLATTVSVLANDFGLKDAMTSDPATRESALANHGNRIDAGLVAFIDADGAMTASTHRFSDTADTQSFPFPRMLIDDEQSRNTAADIVGLPDGVFQLVVAPVFAPRLVGWVGVGFIVDDALARQFKELTQLEVSFMSADTVGEQLMASTLPEVLRPGLASAGLSPSGPLAAEPDVVELGDASFLSLSLQLGGDSAAVTAVLQRSMSDALAGYNRLLEQLAAIFIGTIVLAVVAAGFVAGGVTRPVSKLAIAARRIASGRYDETVEVARSDELGLLANAFNNMQIGIAERESRIIHQSRHDALTDLPNRLALADQLAMSLGRARRFGRSGALVTIDVQSFKAINDTFGHDTGDDALKALARRLTAVARATDTVARYGSNSFVVVCEEMEDADVRSFAERVLESIKQQINLPRTTIRLDLSIGVAMFPDHGDDAETLLRRSEIALYTGRENAERLNFYCPGQDEQHLRRLDLINQLTTALGAEELKVQYQPKLDLSNGRIESAEALVRWHHPKLGAIAPGEFVPIAEQSGLMQALTSVVLTQVVRQIAQWSKAGLDMKVSANISTIDLRDPQFPDRLIALTRDTGVSPSRLCLEITESALMRDPASATNVLRQLRDAGFRLSIDDFGTGYSSLVQLKRMPVSELKIDKSFVLGLPDSEEDAVIVESTIDLAHNLGLSVVAEGVEDARCLEYLRNAGCDVAQGFGISRPQSAAALTEWLRKYAAAANDTQTQSDSPPLEGGSLAYQT